MDDRFLVPISIREDWVVRVGWLPMDLTVEEAEKIGRVVRAYATEGTAPSSAIEGRRGG